MVRTYAQHAANSMPADQVKRWDAADETAEQFVASERGNSFRVLVEMQAALARLARGELARIESELNRDSRDGYDRARQLIRTADRSFEEIDQTLAELVRRASGPADSTKLTMDELLALQNHLRFHRARVYRNQAMCYASGSDDRSAALSLAVQQLGQLLSQVTAGDPLLWQVYLEQVVCYRLLESWDQTRLILDTLMAETAPREIQSRARAEQVRIDLATGNQSQALEHLDQAIRVLPRTAELDFAALEAFLAFWKKAAKEKDTELARQWQQQAIKTVGFLERNHGAYWGRRGEVLLLQVAGENEGDGNVEILTRAADSLFSKGRIDEAIKTYERAAKQAEQAGQLDLVFDLELTSAAVEQHEKRHDAASNRLRRLALSQTTHKKAAQAHLQAVWNAAQAVSGVGAEADPYVALLREHLSNWTEEATADTCRMWLGRLFESRRNWRLAFTTYQAVRSDSEHFPQAVVAAGRASLKWLSETLAADKPMLQVYQNTVDFFEKLVFGKEKRWPSQWSDGQREAALVAARLRLRFPHAASRSGHPVSETARFLQTALDACPDAPKMWRDAAESLLVVAYAADEETRGQAAVIASQLASDSPARLLQLVEDLSALAEQSTDEAQRALARLQLAVLKRLEGALDLMDETQKKNYEIARAIALDAAGRTDQALEAYRTLATANPNSSRIQIGFAKLLSQAPSSSNGEAALDQWRRTVKRLKPNTDDWYLAKYSIAATYQKMGRPKEAAKRLRYLKATSRVDLTHWKPRVDKLLAECTQ